MRSLGVEVISRPTRVSARALLLTCALVLLPWWVGIDGEDDHLSFFGLTVEYAQFNAAARIVIIFQLVSFLVLLAGDWFSLGVWNVEGARNVSGGIISGSHTTMIVGFIGEIGKIKAKIDAVGGADEENQSGENGGNAQEPAKMLPTGLVLNEMMKDLQKLNLKLKTHGWLVCGYVWVWFGLVHSVLAFWALWVTFTYA